MKMLKDCPHYQWLPGLSLQLTFLVLVALAAGCTGIQPTIESRPGTIYSHLPETIDPDAQYVFYIHGKIIEDEGVNAVSPQFGPYEYIEILTYLAERGFNVISEVRTAHTDVSLFADKVAAQVNLLRAKGVPNEHITVIGFSKGAWITIITSARLEYQDLNFVLIGICGEELDAISDLFLVGRILSLYETSDEYGSTCQPLIDRSPGVTDFVELEYNTGKGHGAFYTADPAWLDPVISWIGERGP